MKIAYYIHGRGRGHASRAIKLIPKLLKKGYQITIYSSDDAIAMLAAYKITTIKRDRNVWTFLSRIFSDIQNLRRERPEVVLSDGDAPSVYAARILGVKTIAMGHGLIIPYCKHPFPLPHWPYLFESLKSLVNAYFAHHRIAVHFVPISPKSTRTLVVRPDIIESHEAVKREDYLVSYFRDDIGSSVLKLLTQKNKIHNFGHPVNIEGVTNHPIDQESFLRLSRSAAGIIGTAGSNLIYEALMLKKPILCIYQQGDFEQAINAKYVEITGIGMSVNIGKLNDATVEQFFHMDPNEQLSKEVRQMPFLSDGVASLLSTMHK